MNLIHCSKEGCHKIIPEDVYIKSWKSLGFKIIEDTNDVSSIVLSSDDYDKLSFQDLKKIAKEKGINTYKMKQEEIIEAIRKLEE
jgi:hypothetical protein